MLMIATAVPAVGLVTTINEKSALPQPLMGVEWEKTYGGPEADKFWSIEETDDHGYIVSGTTEVSGNIGPYVVKVDSIGVEEWNWTIHDFTYNDTEYNITNCWCDDVIQVTDGGYIACFMLFFIHDLADHVVGGLVKLDANGAQEWLRIFGEVFEWSILPEELLVVNDGILGVGAKSPILDVGVVNRSSCMFKVNDTGELQWHQIYDKSPIYDWLRSICSTGDGYLLVGNLGVIAGIEYSAHFIKTDSNGIEEWSKTCSDGEGFTNIIPTTGGYILSGLTKTYGGGGHDAWVVKIDADGNRLWNKTFGEASWDQSQHLEALNDNSVVMTVTINWGMGADAWIINLDSDGNVIWKEIYGGEGAQFLLGICATDDGGCIASGISGPWDGTTSDALLVKYAPFPELALEMKSGIGVKATITNNGLGDATNVPWEITVQGGILGLINKTVNGTIDIAAEATESISSGLLLGFGGIDITVTVGFMEKTVEGTQLLILTLLKQ
jgi:hypothetical protein